jgi:hypothetical protein
MKFALAVMAVVFHVLAFCDAYAHGDHKPLTAKGLTPLPGDRLRARIILPNGDELSAIFSFR